MNVNSRQDYFDELYTRDPDPWRYGDSAYEDAKYGLTLASLPCRRFRSALEVGCSIGVLSRKLAMRCDSLLALDVSPVAIGLARRAAGNAPGLKFLLGEVPEDWPVGCYDLIVLSEVLYYLTAAEIATLARLVARDLDPGGHCVLVNWLGDTATPISGTEAAQRFERAFGRCARLGASRRFANAAFRLDLLAKASRTV